ncbi:MAG: tRNA lysidine(34) synthetase TilS [Planctomycetota bacterium]
MFEKKVAGFIKGRAAFGTSDRILLAVSGGADSTALMHVMSALKAEGVTGAELLCTHLNHQLRGGEADADEEFVVKQAGDLKLSVITGRIDVRGYASERKLSIETAARQLRIEKLIDMAKANGCGWIATGHQKNDNAETVLQRLARGTGIRGLGGIWPVRDFGKGVSFVRPLLCVSRDEIVEYLQGRGLQWCQDRTNVDYSYRRNFIRHQLLPELQRDCSGSLIEQLSELAETARKFYSLVCERAEKAWEESADFRGGILKVNLEVFRREAAAVKVELVRRGLTAIGSGEGDLTQKHYERILQLAEQNEGGKRIELPRGFVVQWEYDKLIFMRAGELFKAEEQTAKSMQVEIPGQVRFGRYLIEARVLEASECDIEKFRAEKNEFTEWFDLEKVKGPLAVRFRQAGDRFTPLGLGEQKKVGKFLTAALVRQELRKKVLVVCDSEKIIWVWPIRISELVKLTNQTRKVVQLKITDAKQN